MRTRWGLLAIALGVLATACGGPPSIRTGPDAARFEVRAIEQRGRTKPQPKSAELAVGWHGQWLLLGPTLANRYDLKTLEVLGVHDKDEYILQMELAGTAAGRAIDASRKHLGLAFLVDRQVVHTVASDDVFGNAFLLGDTDVAVMNVDLFSPRAVAVALAEKIFSSPPRVEADSPEATRRRASFICHGFVPHAPGLHAFVGANLLIDRKITIRTMQTFNVDVGVWDAVPATADIADCSYYLGRIDSTRRHQVRYLVATNGTNVLLPSPTL